MNMQVFLCALALVESGGNDRAWNDRSGARGRLQITSKVWNQHVNLPFKKDVHSQFWSEFVARRHIDWLKSQGIPDQPWDMAYAWRHGAKGWKRATRINRDFQHNFLCSCHACRVERIYHDAMTDPTVLKPSKKSRKR